MWSIWNLLASAFSNVTRRPVYGSTSWPLRTTLPGPCLVGDVGQLPGEHVVSHVAAVVTAGAGVVVPTMPAEGTALSLTPATVAPGTADRLGTTRMQRRAAPWRAPAPSRPIKAPMTHSATSKSLPSFPAIDLDPGRPGSRACSAPRLRLRCLVGDRCADHFLIGPVRASDRGDQLPTVTRESRRLPHGNHCRMRHPTTRSSTPPQPRIELHRPCRRLLRCA
jgi:hypothetical protein